MRPISPSARNSTIFLIFLGLCRAPLTYARGVGFEPLRKDLYLSLLKQMDGTRKQVDLFSQGDTFLSCKTPLPSPSKTDQPNDWYGWDLQMLTQAWTNRSCTEWFADQPPPGPPMPKTGWWPVCSLTSLLDYREDFPKLGDSALIAKMDSWMQSMDGCAADPTLVKTNPGYVPPSRKDLGLTVMNPEQRADYKSHVEQVREQVIQACCSGDERCADSMRSIGLSFCKSNSAPGRPDNCAGNGAYFMPSSPTEPTGDVTITAFRSVYGVPFTDDATLSHELGHSCSHVRRTLWASSAPSEDRALFTQQLADQGSCELTQSNKLGYKVLFESTGASQATFNCIQEEATGATRALYVNNACLNGCPRSHLEESFADWMAIRSLPQGSWIPQILPGFCGGGRDPLHSSHWHTFQCALKTPTVKSRLIRALGCRQ